MTKTNTRRTWMRGLRIGYELAPILGLLLIRAIALKLGGPERAERIDARAAVALRRAFERLGVIFIKLGQVIGVRADFLPPAYVAELCRLHDRVTPTPFYLVKPFLERELHRPLAELFQSFDETPLATASIGQVHRARYNDLDIVVKFLRPDTLDLLAVDFRLLTSFIAFGMRVAPQGRWKTLQELVHTLEAGFHEEADFKSERIHAERIREQLEELPWVCVPMVISGLCTENVLALEFCSGVRITDVEQVRRWRLDPNRLLNRLVELYARMILLDGYYHADPHPGNFLVQPDGRIVLLDFGLVQRLSARTRRILYDAAQAALTGNVDVVVENLFESGMIGRDTSVTQAKRFVMEFTRISFEVANTRDRVRALESLFQDSASMNLSIPQDLLYAFRLVQMLEGVASHFQPGWNVIANGGPGLEAAFEAFVVKQMTENDQSPFDRLLTVVRFGLGTVAERVSSRLAVLRRIWAT